MESSFLICGFPRSRTLWLSRFLTIPGLSVCEHEASQFAASSEEFWARADCFSESIYGDSDCAVVTVLPALLALRPMTKTVWIHRPMDQVIESMTKAGFAFTAVSANYLEQNRERCSQLFDLVLPYERLGELEVIQALWSYVMNDAPFDYGRWGIMERQRIALTGKDYTGRNMAKFLEFMSREGMQCQMK